MCCISYSWVQLFVQISDIFAKFCILSLQKLTKLGRVNVKLRFWLLISRDSQPVSECVKDVKIRKIKMLLKRSDPEI